MLSFLAGVLLGGTVYAVLHRWWNRPVYGRVETAYKIKNILMPLQLQQQRIKEVPEENWHLALKEALVLTLQLQGYNNEIVWEAVRQLRCADISLTCGFPLQAQQTLDTLQKEADAIVRRE